MTTTIDTIDYGDNLAASAALTAAAKAAREDAEAMARYPACAKLAIRNAECYERVAAALDRARERREPAPWVDPWANHTEPPF